MRLLFVSLFGLAAGSLTVILAKRVGVSPLALNVAALPLFGLLGYGVRAWWGPKK